MDTVWLDKDNIDISSLSSVDETTAKNQCDANARCVGIGFDQTEWKLLEKSSSSGNFSTIIEMKLKDFCGVVEGPGFGRFCDCHKSTDCFDACGVPWGDDSTCTDLCGVPFGMSDTCVSNDCGENFRDACFKCGGTDYDECKQIDNATHVREGLWNVLVAQATSNEEGTINRFFEKMENYNITQKMKEIVANVTNKKNEPKYFTCVRSSQTLSWDCSNNVDTENINITKNI